jgi:hypothetical protein
MKGLCSEIENSCPGFVSSKGNGPSYWLENCFWDQRDSEEAVRIGNLMRLMRLSAKEGRHLLFEAAELLLLELRTMAKTADAAKWEPEREKRLHARQVSVRLEREAELNKA